MQTKEERKSERDGFDVGHSLIDHRIVTDSCRQPLLAAGFKSVKL